MRRSRTLGPSRSRPRPPGRRSALRPRPDRGCRSIASTSASASDCARHGHDRLRLDLVPRAVRGRLPPERQHLGPALHRARSSSPGSTRRTPKSSTRSGCSPSTGTCSRRCSTSAGSSAACSPSGASAGRSGSAPSRCCSGRLILSAPLLADQAGEARNDIVAIFFLLAAVAVVLNAARSVGRRAAGSPDGALLVAGLAAGLAAGTKLNYLLPAWRSLVGLARRRAGRRPLAALWGSAALAALAGGGYWYLRNLAHTGNPLPWFTDLGPISLPGPDQTLGGREGHGVLGYLTDGSVWSDWFLPGLHHGLTHLLAAARRRRPRRPPPRPRPALHAAPPGRRRRRPGGRARLARRPDLRLRAPTECRAASSRASATWRRP